jgi:chromosome segregation ATPase
LAERLDTLQATNASTFGNINASLQHLDDRIIANDNHLFAIQAHQEATDTNLTNFKRDINMRFDELEHLHTRLDAQLKDNLARLKTRMGDAHATLNERIENKFEQIMSSLNNPAQHHHCSRSRSSRSSSRSHHVDDHE